MAWGDNGNGQLGDGGTSQSNVPVKVKLPPGTKVVAVAAGEYHSLAITSAGSVLAWGYNLYGQLGNGGNIDSHVPVPVSLPPRTKVVAVSAGDFHSLALTSSGAVLAWGFNASGELGDGKTANSNVPVKVKLPKGTKAVAVAAGGTHSLAVTSTGSVLAWGSNTYGQLGNGGTKDSLVPVKVELPHGTRAIRVAAGQYHSLALTAADPVLAWGYNAAGQLGDGTKKDKHVPVKVKLAANAEVLALAAGGAHSLALTSSGSVLAWGGGSTGQLGDDSRSDRKTPVAVKLPKGARAVAIAGGDFFSLALISTGSLLAWGANDVGELGNGSTKPLSDVPVKVKLPPGDEALALGAEPVALHGLAVVN